MSYIYIFFFSKILLWDIVEEHRMHFCVSIARVVTRTCHIVALYVHCLSCYIPLFCSTSYTDYNGVGNTT